MHPFNVRRAAVALTQAADKLPQERREQLKDMIRAHRGLSLQTGQGVQLQRADSALWYTANGVSRAHRALKLLACFVTPLQQQAAFPGIAQSASCTLPDM